MATQTDHMKLTKPALNESADITVINTNMDTIDQVTSKILPVITGSLNNSGYPIASGEYFEADGNMYKATQAIPTGQAWSSSATQMSSNGIINALNGDIGTLNGKIGKLDGSTAYASGVDANSYTTSGVYHVGINSNSPTGNTEYGILEVEAVNGGRVTQRFTGGNGILYSRQRYDSTHWGTWQEFALKSDVAVQNYTSQATDSNGHQFLKVYKIGNLKIINARTGATTVAAGDTLLTLPNEMAANYEVFVPTSSSNGSINGQVSLANKTVKMNSLSGNGGNYFAYTLVYY